MTAHGPPPHFTLHLLGTPRVTGPDGAPVDLPLGKPLAALCFVALEPGPVGRSDLGRILWPESTETRARASIRQALWLVRKHTEADVVLEIDGVLRIDPAILALDVNAFEADLSAGRLDEALARWDGGPLRGFAIPDAPAWLGWADGVRSRLEARLGQALEARAAAAGGDERAAFLERALEVRPYRVESWLALVAIRVDQRDAEGADAALARLRQVADEGDEALVREAEERVRLLHRAAFGTPEGRLVPDFVGRAREFSALMEAWRSALSGRPRVVGLVGPAGIGKTALAHEAVKHVEVDGGGVVQARAVRTETGLEYGVLATLVRQLLRRPGAAGMSPASGQVLRSLLPSEGQTAAPVPRGTALADALSDLLDAVSDEAPILILIDDAHCMDEPSALVLLRTLRQLGRSRVLMVWTSRPAEGAGAAALGALRDAAAQGSAALVEPGPLTRAEIAEMVTLLLAERDEGVLEPLADRLHRASGGSPLHAVELLQGMRDQGLLGLDAEGHWTLAEDADPGLEALPETLVVTLRQRVEGVSSDARRLGRELAREGVPVAPSTLAGAAEPGDPRFARSLGELLDRDLVRWTHDDRLQIAHDEVAAAFVRVDDEAATAGPPAPTPPSRLRIGLVAAAVVAAVLLSAAILRPPTDSPPPYGGGLLWLDVGRAWIALEPQDGDGPWPRRDSIAFPRGFAPQGRAPRLLGPPSAPGPIVVGIANGDPAAAPDAAIFVDGRIDTVYSSAGDDLAHAVDPAGGAFLVNVQNPDTLPFRHMAVRVRRGDAADTAVVAAGAVSYAAGGWSADGRLVLLTADAPWDTVVVADPGGRRLGTLPGPDAWVGWAGFCGSPRVLVESFPPGGLSRLTLWDPRDGAAEPVRPSDRPLAAPTCSPDGSALAYLARDEERTWVVVEPLDGGAPRRFDVTDRRPTWVVWSPPPSAAPAAVRITSATRTLRRGDRIRMEAAVLDRAGRPLERSVEWTSDDPAIASVVGAGLVTGNRPGATTIRAVAEGWIEDSVRVEVAAGEDPQRIALGDSFPALDLDRWIPLGDPWPRAVEAEGRPALDLTGDGRFADGIGSREAFDLSGGGTLEVVFRMEPFRRIDRNRIALCLMDADLGSDPNDPGAWTQRQSACVTWPADEGPDFDPDRLALTAGRTAIGAVPIDTLLQAGLWNRLSLQLRADGRVSAVIGDSLVAEHPTDVRNDSTVRWRIMVLGAALDNRLLLRDLTLWREERVPR